MSCMYYVSFFCPSTFLEFGFQVDYMEKKVSVSMADSGSGI